MTRLTDGTPVHETPETRFKKSAEGRTYRPPRIVPDSGAKLIYDPLTNKGTSWSFAERDRLHIRGLVPPCYFPAKHQMERLLKTLRRLDTPLEKYNFLSGLQDRNEVIFYRLLSENITELAPIIYTPTVGEVCLKFQDLFRRPRGMYFSAYDQYEMSSMVYNWPHRRVDVIVVTDGSRILGLGDLGLNGMGIPIGKLSLYVAAGGINPAYTLPIMLDVGTDNEALRNDPLYLGIRQPRLKGPEYLALVDEFMRAVHFRYPHALIQFEDFSIGNARVLLDRYRGGGGTAGGGNPCFNDDIQGTGATALAGAYAAQRKLGLSPKALTDQRIVVVGAGSAGLGVADALRMGMSQTGATPEAGRNAFYVVDNKGLIGAGREGLTADQRAYGRGDLPDGLSLVELIRRVKPTILLGLSGVGGLFTEEVVRTMAAHTPSPIIFPMSNPSSKSECTPQQALDWSDGRAIVASGSPFPVSTVNGLPRATSQANNFFIFPGVGLAAVTGGCTSVSDAMFYAAAQTLASSVTQEDLDAGKIYPDTDELRETSASVAAGVLIQARSEGLTRSAELEAHIAENGAGFDSLRRFVELRMWSPRYSPLVPAGALTSVEES